MPPTRLFQTSLPLVECEQRFERLARGGFYVWKQITGRSDSHGITGLVGPEQLVISREGSGEFRLKPSWMRQRKRADGW